MKKIAHFKIHTPALIQEIANNSAQPIYVRPLQILQNFLGMIAQRAAELDDTELNRLMAEMALYEKCDPYSKEFDEKIVKQCSDKKIGSNVVEELKILREVFAQSQNLEIAWSKTFRAGKSKTLKSLSDATNAAQVFYDRQNINRNAIAT